MRDLFLKKITVDEYGTTEYTDKDTGKVSKTGYLCCFMEATSKKLKRVHQAFEELKVHEDVKKPEELFVNGKVLFVKVKETQWQGNKYYTIMGIEK
ncbi:MAG: hypothetical protein HON90_07665 [Halobacteriovoraceae bacterium]|jgi:hypothetical protein|nr:hypothetical protein [Halobacteriovoraceae bacterium]